MQLAVPESRRSLGTTTVRPRQIPSDTGSSRFPRLLPVLLAAAAVAFLVTPGWAQEQKEAAYPSLPWSSNGAVHLSGI